GRLHIHGVFFDDPGRFVLIEAALLAVGGDDWEPSPKKPHEEQLDCQPLYKASGWLAYITRNSAKVRRGGMIKGPAWTITHELDRAAKGVYSATRRRLMR